MFITVVLLVLHALQLMTRLISSLFGFQDEKALLKYLLKPCLNLDFDISAHVYRLYISRGLRS